MFIGCFIFITLKLFYLQTFKTVSQNVDYVQTHKIQPERGRIFDRGHFPLAVNQIKYRLFVEPKKIKDQKRLIKETARLLAINEASIAAKIDTNKNWILVQLGIDQETKVSLEKLDLDGIGFEEESYRYYPEASLAAHLLGFLGRNSNGDKIGYFGLEGYYDKELSGLPGLMQSERDLLGRPIFLGTQEKIDAENGRDLILTIDKSVQSVIKRRLKSALETYRAKEGCIIVVDPNTLEILGLSCLPDFDPDRYYLFNESFFKNPAISDLYEPGSTFKPLIVAAALEEKAIKPDEIFQEKGPVTVGEYTIRTWNDQYEGAITTTRILEKSSNVGMVMIGEKLNNNRIYRYLQKYGFGNLTDIDLQGEVSGYLKPKSQWYPIDFATVTFGQGIAVTPIQMIRAFAAVINGGKIMRPHLVEKLATESDEQIVPIKKTSEAIGLKTSETVKKMLIDTVEHGEAVWAKPKGYIIGGKTGTAQVAIKGHYDPTKTIASFIGFAPADKPRFLALVILREPQTSQWGSETAAPLFFEVAKDLIVYYNITAEQ